MGGYGKTSARPIFKYRESVGHSTVSIALFPFNSPNQADIILRLSTKRRSNDRQRSTPRPSSFYGVVLRPNGSPKILDSVPGTDLSQLRMGNSFVCGPPILHSVHDFLSSATPFLPQSHQ